MTPMARTLKLLRQQGFVADVVERWIPHAGIKRDLFGCLDVVAVHPALPGVLGVQTTTRGNAAARLHKIRQQGEIAVWLRAGNRVEVWGWERRGHRWCAHRFEVKAGDIVVLITPRRRPRRQRRGERQRSLFDIGGGRV
jgi:hypothetical protein